MTLMEKRGFGWGKGKKKRGEEASKLSKRGEIEKKKTTERTTRVFYQGLHSRNAGLKKKRIEVEKKGERGVEATERRKRNMNV